MQPSATTKPRVHALNTMRAKGLGLCALGTGLLAIPLLSGLSPLLAAYAGALRPAGWFTLAAGVVLLCLHHIARTKRAKTSPAGNATTVATDTPAPTAPTAEPFLVASDVSVESPAAVVPSETPTLGQLRDELKKKAGRPAL